MSIEKARKYFEALGIADRIQEFEVSSATVALAAEALGCEPDRIAKSLTFRSEDGCIMVVASGMARIDNRKFKDTFGRKATMLTPDEAVEFTGHAVGGVCPFAVGEKTDVRLDISLKKYNTVFPAVGSDNSAIELTIPELEQYSKSNGWVDVCKEPAPQE